MTFRKQHPHEWDVTLNIKGAALRATSSSGGLQLASTETLSFLKMVFRVVLLLFLFKVAAAGIPHKDCDPVDSQTPTKCSNYNSILYLNGVQEKLTQGQEELQQRLQALEGKKCYCT